MARIFTQRFSPNSTFINVHNPSDFRYEKARGTMKYYKGWAEDLRRINLRWRADGGPEFTLYDLFPQLKKGKYRMSNEMRIRTERPSSTQIDTIISRKGRPREVKYHIDTSSPTRNHVKSIMIYNPNSKYGRVYDSKGVSVIDRHSPDATPIRHWTTKEWRDRIKSLESGLGSRKMRPYLKENLNRERVNLEQMIRRHNRFMRNLALASIPVTAGSAGIGAGIARFGSSRRANPDETPEERKQRINKATKKGALIGGGLGLGASAALMSKGHRFVDDYRKDQKWLVENAENKFNPVNKEILNIVESARRKGKEYKN